MNFLEEKEGFTIDASTSIEDYISLKLLSKELNMDKDELWRLIMINNKNYTYIGNHTKVRYVSFGKDPDRMIFLFRDEVKEALNAMFQYNIDRLNAKSNYMTRKAKGLI